MLTFRIKTPMDQFMDWMEEYRRQFGNLPSSLTVDRFSYYELVKDVHARIRMVYPVDGFGMRIYGVAVMCEGDTNEP